MPRRLIPVLLSLLIGAAGCGSDNPVEPLNLQSWTAARQKWQAARITHYRYTSTLSCFCPLEVVQPITAEYRNGQLVSASYADGRAVPPAFAASRPSIDSLFSEIIANRGEYVDRVEASYDAQYGYPRVIQVIAKPIIADGESERRVTTFERLP
jgi:hypothetical protein